MQGSSSLGQLNPSKAACTGRNQILRLRELLQCNSKKLLARCAYSAVTSTSPRISGCMTGVQWDACHVSCQQGMYKGVCDREHQCWKSPGLRRPSYHLREHRPSILSALAWPRSEDFPLWWLEMARRSWTRCSGERVGVIKKVSAVEEQSTGKTRVCVCGIKNGCLFTSPRKSSRSAASPAATEGTLAVDKLRCFVVASGLSRGNAALACSRSCCRTFKDGPRIVRGINGDSCRSHFLSTARVQSGAS